MSKNETVNTPETLEEALETIASLQKVIAEKTAENKQLAADIKEKDEMIKEIRTAKVAGVNPTFYHNGKKWVCKAPLFRHKDVEYTAEKLVNDKDLQAELIKLQAGIIECLG